MDNSGRIGGRVSIIDIIIVVALIAVVVGFIYRQTSESIGHIISPDETFFVTIESAELRHFVVEAVDVGDIMFRQHIRQPLGTVIDVFTTPAMDIMHRTDGTAVRVEMENRYSLHVVLEVQGTIRDTGYFVNGNDHIATGSEIALISNRVIIPMGRVQSISAERPQ